MPGEDRPPADQAEHLQLQKALRESVILRELADILNSSLDLKNILKELMKRTTELCEVERCAVFLVDESWGVLRPATYYIASPQTVTTLGKAAEAFWYTNSSSIDAPVIQQLLANDGTLYIKRVSDLARFERQDPSILNVYSVLLIALVRDGRMVGMLSLDDPGKLRTFNEEQLAWAKAISQQAAVAVDNARLYEKAQMQQRRAEQLIERARAIYQVAKTVNSSEELPIVLQLATGYLVEGLEASAGLALLLDENQSILRPAGPSDALAEYKRLPEESILINHLPSFRQVIQSGHPELLSKHNALEGEIAWFYQTVFKNILIVPLTGSVTDQKNGEENAGLPAGEEHTKVPRDGACLGLIVIYYVGEKKPGRGHYAFAQDIAAQCALAIEKAQLMAETRRAADLANERANTLETVFQAMSEGICIVTYDEQIQIHNHAAASFLGIPVHVSMPIKTFLQSHPAYTMNGQLISFEDFPLTRALRDNKHIRGERFVTTRTDESQRIIEVSISPMKGRHLGEAALVCAFRDVTVQIRADERIRQALETFLQIAEAVSHSTDISEILQSVLANTLTLLQCLRGTVYLFQQADQTFDRLLSIGFASEEEEEEWLVQQQSWVNMQNEKACKLMEQLRQGHATLVGSEYYAAHTNPFEEWHVLAAPIKHNQQLLGLILVSRTFSLARHMPQTPAFNNWDITIIEGIAQLAGVALEQARWQQEAIEARTSEAAMRDADTLKDEFLAITAHEFRNPLAVILARSQGAQRSLNRITQAEKFTPASLSINEHLETIAAQAKQLNNIVTTFLEATRINRGQFSLKTENVDLEAIARKVVENQVALTEQHELSCHVEQDARPYLVLGDQARLAQVIANLVENAIKYSPLGGPVSVFFRRSHEDSQNEMIEVCIADKGIGIPLDAQSRLFERFYRVPQANNRGTRGVGLGLYIVAQLIQMHGGNISVDSPGILGQGSRFTFTIPALPIPVEAT